MTDETWTVLHHNEALDAWSGGWYTAADAADRHLVAYLFSENAEAFLPNVHAIRRASIARLRYQYTRNLSPRFRSIIDRLIAASPEAADLWARHEVAFAPHEDAVRLRANCGIVDAHVVFTPLSPRLWSFTMILPPVSECPERRAPALTAAQPNPPWGRSVRPTCTVAEKGDCLA